jgi:hypothetical protein
VTSQDKDMLDQQIGRGGAMAGQFAGSMRTAANELDQQSPLMAGFTEAASRGATDEELMDLVSRVRSSQH